jgi:hypothetical protein
MQSRATNAPKLFKLHHKMATKQGNKAKAILITDTMLAKGFNVNQYVTNNETLVCRVPLPKTRPMAYVYITTNLPYHAKNIFNSLNIDQPFKGTLTHLAKNIHGCKDNTPKRMTRSVFPSMIVLTPASRTN